ncbi:MAG: beta-propeller domain-containing protein [Candidatus Aenigmarchaeota archaeon]|nr:beta-propeller domain-containing protein [Candidatus Aenigmarchaeota archaeon]
MDSRKKGFAPILMFGLIVLVGLGVVFAAQFMVPPGTVSGQDLKKFSSCDQIKSFLSENSGGYGGYGMFSSAVMRDTAMQNIGGMAPTAAGAEKGGGGAGSEDYSATNIQVAGVDEPDIVKNDGKYIYTVSGNSIFIIDAYPAEGAQILSTINSSGVSQIFVNGDRLAVFGNEYEYYGEPVPLAGGVAEKMIAPPYYRSSTPKTYIHVYDISDRANPVLKRNISIEGSYFDARMIGDYVYAIMNKPVYFTEKEPIITPMLYTESDSRPACGCSELYYFDIPDYGYQFTIIASLNVKEDSGDPQTTVIMSGYTENMYVSQNNIYISYMKRISQTETTERMLEAIKPILPNDVSLRIAEVEKSNESSILRMARMADIFQNYYNSLSETQKADLMQKVQDATQKVYEDIAKETEKTVIHKISIDNGKIEYKTQGEVPGHLLNQFSLDENNGFLRVATTTSGTWNRMGQQATPSKNHVYVLDAGLAITGKLEDLAPGESIYSARFIGDRAYLVTFKKIDPLFVIDLSDPNSPKLLGKLKIPGYSDYLHPYDENHIIGIGKEAVDAEGEQRDFAWYQGVKLSLFDVSDVNSPKEIAKYVIGDRGTDSTALHEHKAFLFSREKNLLVIPIQLAEIDESKYPGGVPASAYGDYTFQGAYVFSLDLENGFSLKGRITHADQQSLEKSGYYWYSPFAIERSLYIGNNLYTISSGMVKANSLTDLSELKAIKLPVEQPYYPPLYRGI